jgi:hypothetical protein
MTQRAALTYAIENLSDAPADVLDKLNAMLVALDKKNSAERKPTAKQVANEGIKTAIAEWMEQGVSYDAATITKTCPACEGLSVNKVSALLTQMGKDGTLTVTEDKRKKIYTLA